MKPPTYFQRAAGMRAPMRYLTPLHPFSRAARANESESIAEVVHPSPPSAEEAPQADVPFESTVRPPALGATPHPHAARPSATADEPPRAIVQQPIAAPHETASRHANEESPRAETRAPEEAPEEAPEPAVRRSSSRVTARRGAATITTNSVETEQASAPAVSSSKQSRIAVSHVAESPSPANAEGHAEPPAAFTPRTARPVNVAATAAREIPPEREPLPSTTRAMPIAAQPLPASANETSAPQTVDRGVHIGAIEVRVIAPPVEAAPAPVAASAPLSRGFSSPIGLRQS